MALKTVGNLRDGVAALLTGTDLNNVTNLYQAFQRGARKVLQKVDVPEAGGTFNLNLYNGVYDYAAPTTVFGSSIVDFRPQGNSRTPLDYTIRRPSQQFDRNKKFNSSGYSVVYEWNNGVPVIRVSTNKPRGRILLDSFASTTGWVNGGSASAPTLDSNTYYESPASLRFTLTGASSGYLEKTLSGNLDLTDYQGVGMAFVAIYTPSGANLTNLILRIGSDSSNYYQVTQTTGFLGAWADNSWTLVAFDLSTASTVGTPVITAMKYVRITATHAATLTNFRLGTSFIALASPHQLMYSSDAIFIPSGSSPPSVNITNDDDTIIFNNATFNLYEHQCALEVALQQGGSGSLLYSSLDRILNGARSPRGIVLAVGMYDLYEADNPSRELRQVGNWYDD